MLFDTHAHLECYRSLSPLPPQGGEGQGEGGTQFHVLSRARAAGVTRILDVCTNPRAFSDLPESPDVVVLRAAGWTPARVDTFHPSDLDVLGPLARSGRIRALGEIGIDRFHRYGEKGARISQEDLFREQLAIALREDLPVLLHVRDAFDEVFRILENEPRPARGVFHCFSGTKEDAARAQELGYHLSFAGNVTYENAGALRDACGSVRSDRLLLETDSPYLSPAPLRGKRNEPANLRLIADFVAKLRGDPEIPATACRNALALFSSPSSSFPSPPAGGVGIGDPPQGCAPTTGPPPTDPDVRD